MKNLNEYINESIDDNLFYKLNKWFYNHNDDKQEFKDVIDKWNKIPKPNISDIIKGTSIENNLNLFIDYMNDEVNVQDNLQYSYLLTKLLDSIINNKSIENTYIK